MPVKILIVEDDTLLCTVFNMLTTGLGYEIIGITQTGKEAIDLIELQKPDVVLMDIHIEGEIDGIEASKLIYEKFNLPVIYISSDIEDETIKRSIQPNTYGFLVKPIYKSILEITIKFCLAKHKLDIERLKAKL